MTVPLTTLLVRSGFGNGVDEDDAIDRYSGSTPVATGVRRVDEFADAVAFPTMLWIELPKLIRLLEVTVKRVTLEYFHLVNDDIREEIERPFIHKTIYSQASELRIRPYDDCILLPLEGRSLQDLINERIKGGAVVLNARVTVQFEIISNNVVYSSADISNYIITFKGTRLSTRITKTTYKIS
jgi:hypothetical protein